MSFFAVERYQPDENVVYKNDVDAILSKLQEKAKSRKLEREKNKPPTDGKRRGRKRKWLRNQDVNESKLANAAIGQVNTNKNGKPMTKETNVLDMSDDSDFVNNKKLATEDYQESEPEPKIRKKHKKKKLKNLESDSERLTHVNGVENEQVQQLISEINKADESRKSKKVNKKAKQLKASDDTTERSDNNIKAGVGVDKNTHDVITNDVHDEDAASKTDHDTEEEDDTRDHGNENATETQEEDGLNEDFTVIGSYKHKQIEEVKRRLPHWLSHPSVISANIRQSKVELNSVQGLDPSLTDKLKENGITHFFPVQKQLIPVLLDSFKTNPLVGPAGYRPSDICCSAPTGSGKTLAFVLPIIQALLQRTVCSVRALAILPVGDLATQVYNVFQMYCQGTGLKVGLITGQKSFASEQSQLVKKSFIGYRSRADIIVATPGRLVDHINKTQGFTLQQLRFLVIDEADRTMDEIKHDWLSHVERAAYGDDQNDDSVSEEKSRRPRPISAANYRYFQKNIPLQKLLFSATLSQNPEKLEKLNLFQPKLFTSVTPKTTSESEVNAENTTGEFIGKYTTPTGLTEFYTMCTSSEKPLVLLYYLHQKKFKNVLCFTNSTEATHRLYHLVKLYGGIKVQEFSSKLHASRRRKIVKQFEAGKVNMIICSDAMARGMDVSNVQFVISYEMPPYLKTYIHRVGRTARAGQVGTAVTLLEKKQIYHFKKMIKAAGKNKIKEMKLGRSDLKPFVEDYQQCLKDLEHVMKLEKKNENSKW